MRKEIERAIFHAVDIKEEINASPHPYSKETLGLKESYKAQKEHVQRLIELKQEFELLTYAHASPSEPILEPVDLLDRDVDNAALDV